MQEFAGISPFVPSNGGYFISRGIGTHPTRVLDSDELILVTGGTLELFEEERKFQVNSGGSLLLFSGRRHGGLAQYPPDLTFYWFHFTPADSRGERILDALPQHAVLRNPEKMSVWFRQLLSNANRADSDPVESGLLLTLMLAEIAGTDNSNRTAFRQLAVKAHDFITLHFAERITTSDIAAKLQCNPDYLGRIFREAYGTSPIEQLNNCRIGYAVRLLLESTANINEIAEAAGFHDMAYFRRKFRQATGIGPAAYRRQYGKVHVNTE